LQLEERGVRLNATITPAQVVLRVCKMMRITLTEEVVVQLKQCKRTDKFLLVDGDIEVRSFFFSR
jgi:hypothetical protein